MSKQGEFQKRLCKWSSLEGVYKVEKVPLGMIEKWIDAAKQEFPFLERFIIRHPKLKDGDKIIEQCLKAQEQWFQKWFGDEYE